jgi:predicted DNA-binding transcriptional regulator AlpA
MPFTPYAPKQKGLLGMRDAARVCGMGSCWFWRLVKEQGLIEAPKVKIGQRFYYDNAALKRVVQQVAEYRQAVA